MKLAYVMAWVCLAESPFVIWGSQSRANKWFAWLAPFVVVYIQEAILGYNVVSGLFYPFGRLGIDYGFPALGLALFLLGRLVFSERLLILVLGLELMSVCVIIVYGNFSSPPSSLFEALGVAALSAASSLILALALFGVGKFLRRWLHYDRLPFVLGIFAPVFLVPLNPTTLAAYLIGAGSGWLLRITHAPLLLARKSPLLAFLSLIVLCTVLIVSVQGTSDVFYFDLSVGLIFGCLVQQVTLYARDRTQQYERMPNST